MRNSYLQVAQMITGVCVAILLAIHLAVQRLDVILGFVGIRVDHPLGWDSMLERARQGSWVGIYIALLAFALFHALNGLRNILLEMNISASGMRVYTWVIVALGIVFLVLGTYTPIMLLSQ
jgi:succinate dehydrogenase/fumarate reductase cytochrome b subunit